MKSLFKIKNSKVQLINKWFEFILGWTILIFLSIYNTIYNNHFKNIQTFKTSLIGDFKTFLIVSLILSSIVLFWIGRKYFINVKKMIQYRKLNMALPILISSLFLYIFSVFKLGYILDDSSSKSFFGKLEDKNWFFIEVVDIIIIILTGDLITDGISNYLTNKANSLQKANVLKAKLYNIKTKKITIKDPKDIKVNDILLVGNDEKIPLDGYAWSDNEIIINEKIITGESKYIFKPNYSFVISGTENMGEPFYVKVSKISSESTIAVLNDKLKQVQKEKAPLQEVADRFLKRFTPAILIIAILTFLLQFFVGYYINNDLLHIYNSWKSYTWSSNFKYAITATATVLVVACPCAFGIATPIAIIVSLIKAKKTGLIFTNIKTLSKIKNIKTIAFDKTGTITHGAMEVNHIWGDEKYLENIYFLEKNVSHPLAKSFCNYYESKFSNKNDFKKWQEKHKINDLNVISGRGIEGILCDHKIQIISYLKALKKYSFSKDLQNNLDLKQATKRPQTLVAFVLDNLIINVIAFSDIIRKNAFETVQWFKKRNINVVMITGDSEKAAKYIANKVGINNYYANQSPIDKLNVIKDLQQKNMNDGSVAYVGDGFNDLLALKQADLSFAISYDETKVASECDIILANSDIRTAAKAYSLVRDANKTIYANFIWAILYNMVTMILAILGIISVQIGIVLMAFSSIILLFISIAFMAKKTKI